MGRKRAPGISKRYRHDYKETKEIIKIEPAEMKNVLLDTDILINFLRGKEKAKEFLYLLIKDSAIINCSAITV